MSLKRKWHKDYLREIVAFAIAQGQPKALEMLGNSWFGKQLGQARLEQWLKQQLKARDAGGGSAGEAITPDGQRMRISEPPQRQQPMRMQGGKGSVPSPEWITNLRSPSKRHYLKNINQKTVAKDLNTVIEPSVNITADVEAIRSGIVPLQGDKFILPNGRIYGYHDGTLYPISGPGFHQLERPAFKALGVYSNFGDTPRSTEILNNMGISSEAREAALNLWRLGQ